MRKTIEINDDEVLYLNLTDEGIIGDLLTPDGQENLGTFSITYQELSELLINWQEDRR